MPGIFIPDDEIVPAFVRLVEATPHLNYYCYTFSAYCAQKEAAHLGLSAWAGDPTKGYELIKGRDKRFGFLVENVAFEKIGIDGALRRASNNLDSMQFIGFFDHLENATARLKREYGLNVALNTRMHETIRKPKLADLPGHIGAMLKRKTEADYEFFREAKQAPTAVLPKAY